VSALKPTDIAEILKQCEKHARIMAADPKASEDARALSNCVVLLALVCASQEVRLRRTEPCPKRGDYPHLFDSNGNCFACGLGGKL
jgi:hypothetical protein